MSAVIDAKAKQTARCALGVGALERVIAQVDDKAVTLRSFHAQVRALAAVLPAGQYVVNLCEDRYQFMVAFCAAALRGQVNLLPPSRAPAVIRDVMRLYSGVYSLGDGPLAVEPPAYWRLPDVLNEVAGDIPQVDEIATVAIAFTSGSTGTPKPFPKTMRQFRGSTERLVQVMEDLWHGHRPSIVATVPAQHMFGLEQSVMMPLLADATLHGARPFFPQDVARALAQVPAPRMLITTPVHLRVLVESEIALPPIAGCVSATAPLDQSLAQVAESRFGGQVREIFGSTETCIFAHRRTARERHWTPLPGVSVQAQPDGVLVHAPYLQQPVVLADLMQIEADGRFHVCGRRADLLEIAGKRASLADLTRRLLAVPGVRDGAMVQLDGTGKVQRIAALVAADGLSEAELLASLSQTMDQVFLPRRIRFVDALPRNDAGKLPRAEVLRLLGQCDGPSKVRAESAVDTLDFDPKIASAHGGV